MKRNGVRIAALLLAVVIAVFVAAAGQLQGASATVDGHALHGIGLVAVVGSAAMVVLVVMALLLVVLVLAFSGLGLVFVGIVAALGAALIALGASLLAPVFIVVAALCVIAFPALRHRVFVSRGDQVSS